MKTEPIESATAARVEPLAEAEANAGAVLVEYDRVFGVFTSTATRISGLLAERLLSRADLGANELDAGAGLEEKHRFTALNEAIEAVKRVRTASADRLASMERDCHEAKTRLTRASAASMDSAVKRIEDRIASQNAALQKLWAEADALEQKTGRKVACPLPVRLSPQKRDDFGNIEWGANNNPVRIDKIPGEHVALELDPVVMRISVKIERLTRAANFAESLFTLQSREKLYLKSDQLDPAVESGVFVLLKSQTEYLSGERLKAGSFIDTSIFPACHLSRFLRGRVARLATQADALSHSDAPEMIPAI